MLARLIVTSDLEDRVDANRFRLIRELFEEATLRDVELREVFLQEKCGDDSKLLEEVRELLAAGGESLSWIDQSGGVAKRIMAPAPMAYNSGTKLGTYEIVGLLGVGGMGEVYRARDTRLKREVAIKVLPDLYARDAERVARFQREAELLASISHSHIGAIFDLVTLEDTRFLVLELVEGPTLADRIRNGPLAIDEALRIAKQIAEALESAHEKRIVHRDLKPENIKIGPDGNVKVLDFGLARLHEIEGATDPSRSPTIGSEPGLLLGTPTYMSPEQAKGQVANRASDVWAFGCVLFEMLTGKALFRGESTGETLAEVLKSEPDWSRLPAGTPPSVRRLLRRCLEKDRRLRLRDIGDAGLELDDAWRERESPVPVRPPLMMGRREWLMAGSGVALAGVAGFFLGKTGSSEILSDQEIRIGAFCSLTQSDQEYAISTRTGLETAVEEQNQSGLLNRTVRLILEDDRGKVEGAERAVRELIQREHVVALLGEFKSGLSLAGGKVAQQLRIPMISHGATSPDVTKIGDCVFRICFTDLFQGYAMAKFAYDKGFRAVAVFRQVDTYSAGLASAFEESFKQRGGTITDEQRYGKEDDFRSQLKLLLDGRPEALYIPGYYTEVQKIAQQARDLAGAKGLKLAFLGGDGWDSADLLQTDSPLDQSYYSSHYSVDDLNPRDSDFIESFRKRNGKAPDAVGALAYDSAKVLFNAIDYAMSTDPEKIRAAIARTTNFPGVTGRITIDSERNTPKPVIILQVQNGRRKYIETIEPE